MLCGFGNRVEHQLWEHQSGESGMNHENTVVCFGGSESGDGW